MTPVSRLTVCHPSPYRCGTQRVAKGALCGSSHAGRSAASAELSGAVLALLMVERELGSGTGNTMVFPKGWSCSSETPSPLRGGRYFSVLLQETVSYLLLPLLAVIQVRLLS